MPRNNFLLIATVALGALTTACGTPDEAASTPETTATRTSAPSTTSSPAAPAKAYTVEELAAAVGCTPQFQGKLLDYRKALCHTSGVDYLLLDFQAEEGQRAWLDTAIMYGGVYLVGERWVLSASTRERMVELSTTLGGTIEENR